MQWNSAPAQLIEHDDGTFARHLPKVRVTVLDGPDRGAFLEDAQDEIRIGSSDENDLRIRDPAVSRRHVALRPSGDGVRVLDLGSTNGTFMGDMRVHDVVVRGATELVLGTTAVRVELPGASVEHDLSPDERFGRLVGAVPSMRAVFAVLDRVAPSDLAVLIEGEAGTGKTLAAEAIHRKSPRANGVFVAVDCAAKPPELVVEELFGRGQSTVMDALRMRLGAVAAADGGTLFLDEVAALPLDVQARLLRALETPETHSARGDAGVGGVRVVASTCRNIAREVSEGRFRQDLLYRLAAVVVKLPPLRARMDDLPLLVDTMRDELNRRRAAQGLPAYPPFDARAMELLERHDFPGNVRELRSLVERIAVLGATPDELAQGPRSPAVAPSEYEVRTDLPFHEAKGYWTERFEKTYLTSLLATRCGNVSAAAREAGIDRRHLQRLMIKHDLRWRGESAQAEGDAAADPR